MRLDELRESIGSIDEELVKLLCERMRVAEAIGQYKSEQGLPVLDVAREVERINTVSELAEERYSEEVENIFRQIMCSSRRLQERFINEK